MKNFTQRTIKKLILLMAISVLLVTTGCAPLFHLHGHGGGGAHGGHGGSHRGGHGRGH